MHEHYQDEFVAEIYDSFYEGVAHDLPFYEELALGAVSPVLELGCGTGRIALPIARGGVSVVGLDSSRAMLDVARSKSAGVQNVRWVEGDMRDFALEERFGLALIPYRAFQHLATPDDQKRCLSCIHRHLVDGGRLVIDIFNPSIQMIADWRGPKRGMLESQGDYRHPESGNTVAVWALNEYRLDSQHVTTWFLHEEVDVNGMVLSRRYKEMRLRYTFRWEMEHMLSLCGFEVEALYGDFEKTPFGDGSGEQVWVARKEAANA